MLVLDALQAGDSNVIGAGFAIAALSLFALYRRLLPKPIPGIPYDKAATSSLMGDLPGLIKTINSGDGSFTSWMVDQITKHKSPICQVFMSFPSNKPTVIIADAQESQDILLRRGKEFDRSAFTSDFLGGIVPNHHIRLHTNEKFKLQRRLLQDLMTPSFLRNVASKVIYEKATGLIELWETKMVIAKERPFSVSHDVFHFALDAVVAFSFGGETGYVAIEPQIKLLADLSEEERKKLLGGRGMDDAMSFPAVKLDEEMTSVLELTEGLEQLLGNPMQTLVWKIMEWTSLRRAMAAKNRFIRKQLAAAVSRLEQSDGKGGDESWFRSATDLIVAREKRFAAKDGRKPNYMTAVIQDEIFGFLIAGHDTSSTTLLWGLKLLTKHADVQTKLRNALREAFPKALAEGRLPTNDEIHDTHIPYLDATIEEISRHSGTVGGISRDAMHDTVVMGHPIPKGTVVLMCGIGPTVLSPPLEVDDAMRTESSRNAKAQGRVKSWDPEDIGQFKPERWLVPSGASSNDKKVGGDVEFDASAGPVFTFGLGVRGCFGRRLAYVELRTMLTLVVWRFVLESTPEKLSSWNAKDGLTHKPTQAYVRLRTSY